MPKKPDSKLIATKKPASPNKKARPESEPSGNPRPVDPMPPQGRAALNNNEKLESLEVFRDNPVDTHLTSDMGLPIVNTDDSLRVGARGPTLLEDFHLREKIMRFDHERIPERVVHARGTAAHGVFRVYESMAVYTRAAFLCDPSAETPVFVRFSTVVGSRGSADTVRDVRGFATKFYTTEGNFDLVGNNMPVFFIQDGIKFPDFVHAVKPEPAHEMPQASSAHDSFWDFVSLVPESAHMVMWAMSDRAIPRSYRMMEGFGVHTFRLVNEAGKSQFVKFHWKPLLGAHSLVWDEAQKIAGKDPDFHRRDLWNAIESGAFPEYELGVQIVPEGDELKYGFDLLDPTKLLPEELVPVRRIGKLTLNRNPQNFFAETEQVAFGVHNVVPGIDFTDDPLMQARLFSYLDTQLTRLGGPNFAEIPINRPLPPVSNHQQDGFHRSTIMTGKANYHPNSIGGGCPFLADPKKGFTHHPERVDGAKLRERSDSFRDHFSQATLFLNSLSAPERQHLVDACCFEVGKVTRKEVRARALALFQEIDPGLAAAVSAVIGVPVPAALPEPPPGTSSANFRGDNGGIAASPALALANQPKDSIATRVVAVLIADGFAAADVKAVTDALIAAGAIPEIIAPVQGRIHGDTADIEADKAFIHTASVLYDAIYVPGGAAAVDTLPDNGDAIHFVQEAFKHGKAIGATGGGLAVLERAELAGIELVADDASGVSDDKGVVTAGGDGDLGAFAQAFIAAIAKHRDFTRAPEWIPA